VSEAARVPAGSRLLEIGAGQGALSTRLALRHDYLGLELDAESAIAAGRRLAALGRGRLVHGDLSSLGPADTFDVVCAFEVLEHMADDAETLRAWRARLRPGGLLLLSVPAHQHRFGPWDTAVGHYRRYGREQLTELLHAQGFTDVRLHMYGFPLGYLLETARDAIAARRRAPDSRESPEEATARSGRSLQPRSWMGAATRVATSPFRMLQRPFAGTALGTGMVASARRT